MAKETKGSTEQEFTHYIVAIPREDGNYKDPDGNQVHLEKIKSDKTVHTKHPSFEGTTITNFVKNSDYTKA